MNATARLSRARNYQHPRPELRSPAATQANDPARHNDRPAEPQPAHHSTDMLEEIERALEEDRRHECASRPTLEQLQAQAASADFTLVTHQDCSGLLIRRLTIRVEPDDILPFETPAKAKILLDLEMETSA
jgi:hypothetical protein